MTLLYIAGALLWAVVLFAVLRRLAERRKARRIWQANRAEAERAWQERETERMATWPAVSPVRSAAQARTCCANASASHRGITSPSRRVLTAAQRTPGVVTASRSPAS